MDVSEALDILDAIEIKRVGRSLNGLNMNGLTTKKNIINGILKFLSTNQSVIKNSDNRSNSLFGVVLKS